MVQKVIKIGDSLGVTIPKKTVQKLSLKPGDMVEVVIDKEGGQIKFVEVLKDLEEFNKLYGATLKRLAKK